MRTLEALISVIALLALLLFIIPKEIPKKETPDIVKSSHDYFLNTLINSEKHRDCILSATLSNCNIGSSVIPCIECKNLDCLVGGSNVIDLLLDTANAPGFETKCIICQTNPNDRSCLLPEDVTLPETDIYVDSALLNKGNNERLVRLFSYVK